MNPACMRPNPSADPGIRVPTLRLRVSSVAESRIRSGHPWVFASSVRDVNRLGETGELAVIFDRKDRFLAVGLYDADSPIRCRILAQGRPVAVNEAFWRNRCMAARRLRDPLERPGTTGYRWIHGENDGFPGLVLDRYDTTGVLKIYTRAWLPHLTLVVQAIDQVFAPATLVLRTSRNFSRLSDSPGCRDGTVLRGALPAAPIAFQENRIRFEADVVRGQKTGFFLDQRENREWLESVSAGRSVLNAFSFSGGFSLYAARGGAHEVTDLDISQHALDSAARNRDMNQEDPHIQACQFQRVQADAFEWLGSTRDAFDVVVLDPPSLAKRESERTGAIEAYRRLALLGWRRLKPGGIMMASSCSAHVGLLEFTEAVLSGIRGLGGPPVELRRSMHPVDHPSTFPEAAYLKCLCLRKPLRA